MDAGHLHIYLAVCAYLALHSLGSPVIDTPPRYFHRLDATHCQSPKVVNVFIASDGVRLKLELAESSSDFLSPDFQLDPDFGSMPTRPCHYQGVVMGTDGDSMATAETDHGMLSATFSYNGSVYDVPSQNAWLPEFKAARLPPSPPRRCGSAHAPQTGNASRTAADAHKRAKRSVLKVDTNSPVSPVNRMYIQLILVGDATFYEGLGKSMKKANRRLMLIGNIVNGMYKQLGVNVIVVKTLVWTEDPYVLTTDNEGLIDSYELVDTFLDYRKRELVKTPHSVAHLITGRMMKNDVGRAYLSALCLYDYSVGINLDTKIDGSAVWVSSTVAHELGHNLGMKHDEDFGSDCHCPDTNGCIMQKAANNDVPYRFSTCSVNSYNEYSVPDGIGYCISRPPDSSVINRSTATCGNRIVEAGEDCDCGRPSYCNNTCCNPRTCKFTPGASCASGQCCNTDSCSLLARGTECRAPRGVCDLPEFCNGSSEWCPEFDDHLLDGTACAIAPEKPAEVQAYCYRGDCSSRDARCSALFVGADTAAPAEFVELTTHGTKDGYCSYKAVKAVNAEPLRYNYEACTIQNQPCGTLYCAAPSETSVKLNWQIGGYIQEQTVQEYDFQGKKIVSIMIDLTPTGLRDPGMVPNGAECGTNAMCVDSQCVPVSSVVSSGSALPDCNGHGRWTQSRLCYCDAGFAPPNCVRVTGVSINNQPMPSASSGTSYKGNSDDEFVPLKNNYRSKMSIARRAAARKGQPGYLDRHRTGGRRLRRPAGIKAEH